jgi:hypothetical protein
MTKAEYLEFHRAACNKLVAITAKKNADYTGSSGDPFFNFSRVESVGICSTEQGFLTRMFDKFSRVTTFVQKGVLLVEDESVEDTLFDLANYAILMAGYIKSKKQTHDKRDCARPLTRAEVEAEEEARPAKPGELTTDTKKCEHCGSGIALVYE